MSISFTPSQLHVIALAMVEDEFITGAEYTSSYREELLEMCRRNATFLMPYPGSDASPQKRGAWTKEQREFEKLVENSIVQVRRAYWRFRKEFAEYVRQSKLPAASRSGGNMAVVRMYHGLLIDTLAPFL